MDSSSPCSSFRSRASSGFSCEGLCFTSGSPPRFFVAGFAIIFSSALYQEQLRPARRRCAQGTRPMGFSCYPTEERKPGRTKTMRQMACIEDLREQARRKVPKMFFDYADAGSYNQETLRANRADFEKLKL